MIVLGGGAAPEPQQIDAIWDDAWDAATSVVDWAKKAVNTIHEAGELIGTILKTIAPAAAFIPGIGTGLAVAAYAAGAIAAADRIDDIVIGTASAAMPPGLCRVAFDSATAIAKDVAHGRNAFTSCVDACRSAASHAGGPQAVAAFDAAIGAVRGGRIDDRALAALRSQVAQGGQSAALAFDAGVATARGEDAPGVLLAVSRQYIADAGGGPLGLAAFDTGVALAYGETLQQAGFVALKKFVKGGPGEQVVNFIEVVSKGGDPKTALVVALGEEFQKYGGTFDHGLKQLRPYVDAIRDDLSLLNWDSQTLADAWEVAEPYVRSAQVIMQTGQLDELLMQKLVSPAVKSIGRVADTRTEAEKAAEDARWAAVVAANPGVPVICLRADEAKARQSPAYPSLEAQCTAAGGRPLFRAQPMSATVSASKANLFTLFAAPVVAPAPAPKPLPPMFVPPAAIALTRAPPPAPAAPAKGKANEATTNVVVGTSVLVALAGLWWACAD